MTRNHNPNGMPDIIRYLLVIAFLVSCGEQPETDYSGGYRGADCSPSPCQKPLFLYFTANSYAMIALPDDENLSRNIHFERGSIDVQWNTKDKPFSLTTNFDFLAVTNTTVPLEYRIIFSEKVSCRRPLTVTILQASTKIISKVRGDGDCEAL